MASARNRTERHQATPKIKLGQRGLKLLRHGLCRNLDRKNGFAGPVRLIRNPDSVRLPGPERRSRRQHQFVGGAKRLYAGGFKVRQLCADIVESDLAVRKMKIETCHALAPVRRERGSVSLSPIKAENGTAMSCV